MSVILTSSQSTILNLLSKEKTIVENFYLSGGTALAEFYLQHRLSEDLDFFSAVEFSPESISIVLKKIQSPANIKQIRYEQSFNRHLYFLELTNEIIKTEFTYFPFARIERGQKVADLEVDSLLDIAVNKIFTIYQKPRSRDFIDLFFILQQEFWDIADLVKKAKIKFDHHLDPIQLGTQFLLAEEVKDYPRMIAPLNHQDWQKFFVAEARKLSGEILE